MIRAALIVAGLALPIGMTAQQAASPGSGAVLRALDKVSGQSTNYELNRGQEMALGQLTVKLRECRFPDGNPSSDAYAFLDIVETNTAELVFSGWMIASSPALNAMEHSRYDVWVLRCKTS